MTDVPGSAPRSGDVVRPDADTRAGLRVALALAGALGVAAVLGPVALLVRGQWGPLVALDDRTSAAAERLEEASPALLEAARLLTRLGDPLLITLATVVGVAVLLATGRRRSAAFLAVTRVGALVLSQGTKAAVDRARPVFDVPVSQALGASFPSGHALGGTVFWLTTAVVALPLVDRPWRRLLLPGALTVGVVVAATRVLLGVHYLSDVVAGLVLAVGWTAVCAAVFTVWRREEGRPAPVLAEGVEPGPGAA